MGNCSSSKSAHAIPTCPNKAGEATQSTPLPQSQNETTTSARFSIIQAFNVSSTSIEEDRSPLTISSNDSETESTCSNNSSNRSSTSKEAIDTGCTTQYEVKAQLQSILLNKNDQKKRMLSSSLETADADYVFEPPKRKTVAWYDLKNIQYHMEGDLQTSIMSNDEKDNVEEECLYEPEVRRSDSSRISDCWSDVVESLEDSRRSDSSDDISYTGDEDEKPEFSLGDSQSNSQDQLFSLIYDNCPSSIDGDEEVANNGDSPPAKQNLSPKEASHSSGAFGASEWNCRVCTYLNEKPLALACSMCGTGRH